MYRGSFRDDFWHELAVLRTLGSFQVGPESYICLSAVLRTVLKTTVFSFLYIKSSKPPINTKFLYTKCIIVIICKVSFIYVVYVYK